MPQNQRPGLLVACYAIAIFTGAFLVFQVQPIIGRAILPWYGGSPAVWTTCMLFFQTVLLLGYLYAHLLTQIRNVRVQGAIHVTITIVALASLPILPDASWKPQGGGDPIVPILTLLAVHVGLPYLMLSSTGPLMQAWFSRSLPDRSPYRLYALSNVGSLLALLTYPVVFEPIFTVREQTTLWSIGFGVFAAVAALLAGRWWLPAANTIAEQNVAMSKPKATAELRAESGPPSWSRRLAWLLLPALASVLLLAITAHVCQDVAVIPFLWVAPLALYLLSFILCFDSPWWYSRRYWSLVAIASLVGVSLIAQFGDTLFEYLEIKRNIVIEISAFFAVLFAMCMVCHGELVRRKPDPKYLTEFYLMCSAGGALGGFVVAIISPLVFPTYIELHASLIVSFALAAVVVLQDEKWRLLEQAKWLPITVGIVLATIFLGGLIVQGAAMRPSQYVMKRNFYGVLYIRDYKDDSETALDEGARWLIHGSTSHGYQFTGEGRRHIPTMYYGIRSGVGIAIQRLGQFDGPSEHPMAGNENVAPVGEVAAAPRPLRVGVIGLGTGSLAAYGRPGDTYRFYEINPLVESIANEYFTFLGDCRGQIEVVLGDARRTMEDEPPQQYDMIALDAFTGDAIPTHLLTKEAFAVYQKHLASGGVIAAHISNRHLDLKPILLNAAKEFEWKAVVISASADEKTATSSSTWVLLTNNEKFLADPVVQQAGELLTSETEVRMWTDEYSNLLPILR